ncbi:hypothetical protein Hypma_005553 [Hypsizygus marmoreus]|uniref:Uncharacterized protein n=1 Tax=Hypsizygus marmoreus TaxID=39966 RepID=A0A369JY19_HYPMA|nr:hypothetical protein Hypma_005553 [Hypsizygus marmoreus]
MPPHRRTTSKKTRDSEAKQREVEDLARTVVKYSELFQAMAESTWCNSDELTAAHARRYEIACEDLKCANRSRTCTTMSTTDEEIQQYLKDLAARCEMQPKTFDDRVRICFAALAYVQTVLDYMVAHPSRSFKDRLVIIRRITEINQENYGRSPPSRDILPRLVKLIPDNPTTRPVTVEDVKRWRDHPRELVGKAFILHKAIRKVFSLADYYVKTIGGHRYELQFEDCGSDVLTFGLEDTLKMVGEAQMVTNMPS